jgi:hypothetical protein
MISKKNINALKNQLEKHNKSVRAASKKMTLPKLKKSFNHLYYFFLLPFSYFKETQKIIFDILE